MDLKRRKLVEETLGGVVFVISIVLLLLSFRMMAVRFAHYPDFVDDPLLQMIILFAPQSVTMLLLWALRKWRIN